MSEQRIKGQETEVLLIQGGIPVATITDVRSFEMSVQLEILKEGYLGETTDRRDSVYRGVRGKIELHFENQDILALMRSLVDRARRRVALGDSQVNIKTTLNFPNGDRPLVLITKAEFGEIPMSFGSRADYGTVSLDFEAEDFTVL